MSDIFNRDEVSEKMIKSIEVLISNLEKIRDNSPSTKLIESINVNLYGDIMPIQNISTIMASHDCIKVDVWDRKNVALVEKAITESNLGLSLSNNGTSIRVTFPKFDNERLHKNQKLAKESTENCKISIRSIRHDFNHAIKKAEKQKTLSEDESRRYQEEVQKTTDNYINKADLILSKKLENLK